MGADTTVVYASPATNVKVYRETTGSADVQYIRRHTSSVMTLDQWTTSTTAATSRVAADEARTSLAFANASSAVVYICPDGTAPTATRYYVALDPGDTYEAEDGLVELAWSVVANAAGVGPLNIWKGTAP